MSHQTDRTDHQGLERCHLDNNMEDNMEDKKRSSREKRKAYLDQYKPDAAGRYVYKGSYHVWPEDMTRKRFLGITALYSLITLGAMIGAGCIPAPGVGNKFYLIIPYAVGIAAAASVCFALARILGEGDKLRSFVLTDAFEKFEARSGMTRIAAAIAAAGEAAFLVLGDYPEKVLFGVAFIVLEALAFAAQWRLYRMAKAVSWQAYK